MPGMRITVDAAMRARDVSRPRETTGADAADARSGTSTAGASGTGTSSGTNGHTGDAGRGPAGGAAGTPAAAGEEAGHLADGQQAEGTQVLAAGPVNRNAGRPSGGPAAQTAARPARRRGKTGKRRHRR